MQMRKMWKGENRIMTVQEAYDKATKINHIINDFESGRVQLHRAEDVEVFDGDFYCNMINALIEYETILRNLEVKND